MRTLLEALDRRVLLTDGAVSRYLRGLDLDKQRDFWGVEDCIEILNVTQAKKVRESYLAFLDAGADVIRTNTFDASPLSLARHGLGEHAFAINYLAAELAAQAVDSVPGRGRRRFVLGVVRDQGWDVAPLVLEQAVTTQVEALLAGGADGVTLDLTPGAGRAAIFLAGAQKAKMRTRSQAPLTLLCAAGAPEFSERAQSQADRVLRFAHGHPQQATAEWLKRAIDLQGVSLIGGGVTPADTAQLDAQLRQKAEDGLRPWTSWARPADPDEVSVASTTTDELLLETA